MNDIEQILLLPERAASLHQPVDWGEIAAHFREQMQPLVEAFQAIAEALQVAFLPIVKAAVEVAQKVNDAVHTAYLEDGAIYGETQDGMLRWMNERSEIERLHREAESIEQRQAMIRDFKRILAEKRKE